MTETAAATATRLRVSAVRISWDQTQRAVKAIRTEMAENRSKVNIFLDYSTQLDESLTKMRYKTNL